MLIRSPMCIPAKAETPPTIGDIASSVIDALLPPNSMRQGETLYSIHNTVPHLSKNTTSIANRINHV